MHSNHTEFANIWYLEGGIQLWADVCMIPNFSIICRTPCCELFALHAWSVVMPAGNPVKGAYKHWTQDPITQSFEGSFAMHQLKYNYSYSQSVPMLQTQNLALSCTSSLCTPKALFIADSAILNYPDFFDPQCSLLSVLQSQICTYKTSLKSLVSGLWIPDLVFKKLHSSHLLQGMQTLLQQLHW